MSSTTQVPYSVTSSAPYTSAQSLGTACTRSAPSSPAPSHASSSSRHALSPDYASANSVGHSQQHAVIRSNPYSLAVPPVPSQQLPSSAIAEPQSLTHTSPVQPPGRPRENSSQVPAYLPSRRRSSVYSHQSNDSNQSAASKASSSTVAAVMTMPSPPTPPRNLHASAVPQPSASRSTYTSPAPSYGDNNDDVYAHTWYEYTTSTGRPYWFNIATGKTSWVFPL